MTLLRKSIRAETSGRDRVRDGAEPNCNGPKQDQSQQRNQLSGGSR